MCRMTKIEKNLRVYLPDRLVGGTRLARDISDCTRDFKGSVCIEKDGRTVSAGSMIGVLSLGLKRNDPVKVICSGDDEFDVNLCLERLMAVIG